MVKISLTREEFENHILNTKPHVDISLKQYNYLLKKIPLPITEDSIKFFKLDCKETLFVNLKILSSKISIKLTSSFINIDKLARDIKDSLEFIVVNSHYYPIILDDSIDKLSLVSGTNIISYKDYIKYTSSIENNYSLDGLFDQIFVEWVRGSLDLTDDEYTINIKFKNKQKEIKYETKTVADVVRSDLGVEETFKNLLISSDMRTNYGSIQIDTSTATNFKLKLPELYRYYISGVRLNESLIPYRKDLEDKIVFLHISEFAENYTISDNYLLSDAITQCKLVAQKNGRYLYLKPLHDNLAITRFTDYKTGVSMISIKLIDLETGVPIVINDSFLISDVSIEEDSIILNVDTKTLGLTNSGDFTITTKTGFTGEDKIIYSFNVKKVNMGFMLEQTELQKYGLLSKLKLGGILSEEICKDFFMGNKYTLKHVRSILNLSLIVHKTKVYTDERIVNDSLLPADIQMREEDSDNEIKPVIQKNDTTVAQLESEDTTN